MITLQQVATRSDVDVSANKIIIAAIINVLRHLIL